MGAWLFSGGPDHGSHDASQRSIGTRAIQANATGAFDIGRHVGLHGRVAGHIPEEDAWYAIPYTVEPPEQDGRPRHRANRHAAGRLPFHSSAAAVLVRQDFADSSQRAVTPTMPLRKPSTHKTKINPIVNVTHWPNEAR